MIEISKIRYSELNPIMAMHPNPHILLGHEIFWQEKRDGSNIGAYLNEEDNINLRSRNMDIASEDFHMIFLDTDEAENVRELLISMRDEWHDECVIFGELLTKGKSPTRTELHEKNEFIIFDVWSTKISGLIPYTLVYQHCYHFGLPIVDLYGTSRHTTLESLLAFRDKILKIAKETGREGTVGKTFEKNTKYKYFKEKLDLPKLEKKPRHIEDGKPLLPPLPKSEILGALDKALVDLGMSDFKEVKKAMPLFAEYVSVECRKHNCSKPEGNLFQYYRAKLEDMV